MNFKLLWKHLRKAWKNYQNELAYTTNMIPKYTTQIHKQKVVRDIKILENCIVHLTKQICNNVSMGITMGKEHSYLVSERESRNKELKLLKVSALKEGIIVPNLGKLPTKDKVEQTII